MLRFALAKSQKKKSSPFTSSSYLRAASRASPPSPPPPPPVELPTRGGTTEARLSFQTPDRSSTFSSPGRDLRLFRPWLCALPGAELAEGKREALTWAPSFPRGRALPSPPRCEVVLSRRRCAAQGREGVRRGGGREGGSGATPASERASEAGRAFPPLLAPPNPNP